MSDDTEIGFEDETRSLVETEQDRAGWDAIEAERANWDARTEARIEQARASLTVERAREIAAAADEADRTPEGANDPHWEYEHVVDELFAARRVLDEHEHDGREVGS